MVDRGKGLRERGLGWEEEATMEFLKLEFDDLGDYRDFKVIAGVVVRDIPRSAKNSAKDFGLETLDALDVGWFS